MASLFARSCLFTCCRPSIPIASSSRLAFHHPAAGVVATRSVQYDANGRLAEVHTNKQSDTTVFVGNTPPTMGAQQLKDIWEKVGIKVKDVYFPPAYNVEGKRRGRNRRFAFVECQNEHQAQKACTWIHKHGFDVKPAKWDIDAARTHSQWAFDKDHKKKEAEQNIRFSRTGKKYSVNDDNNWSLD